MAREAYKEMTELSELGGIVSRLERSSFASKLKEIPNMTPRQVAALVDIEHDPDHSISESSLSDLASRLRDLAIEFENEQNPSSTRHTDASQAKDHSESSVLTQFALFPELAIGLRLKIWRISLPGPRIIEIYNTKPLNDTHITKSNHPALAWLLRANHESCGVVMSKYQRVPHWALGIRTHRMESIIFLDNSRDVLYLNSVAAAIMAIGFGHTLGTGTADFLSKLTCISFYAHHLNYLLKSQTDKKFKREWLPKMTSLEKIIVTVDMNAVITDDNYRGLPLEFIEYKSGDEKDSPTNEKGLPSLIMENWTAALEKHPEMKGLLDVALVFVEPKRPDPPKLLSRKIGRLAMMVSKNNINF
jgi:hypothetical protein